MDRLLEIEIADHENNRRESASKNLLCKLASFALHLLVLFVLLVGAPGVRLPVPDKAGVRLLTHLYLPPSGKDNSHVVKSKPSMAAPQLNLEKAAEKLDLDGIRLIFKADPGYRMLEVALRRSGGLLAFASVDQPRFAAFAFAAPDWQRTEAGSLLSIDDFLAIAIEEPAKWMAAGRLRQRFLIPEKDPVYALFPAAFLSQLDGAIRQSALKTASSGRVAEATIAFSPVVAQGFVVERVEITQ